MRVGLMTREYPPYVYGGAGVHVEYLSREMAKTIEVDVYAWGETPELTALKDAQVPHDANLQVHFRAAVGGDFTMGRRRSSRARWRRCR